MRMATGALAVLLAALGTPGPPAARAGAKSKAAREAAEVVLKRFGKEAAGEGVEALAQKLESLALRHGDDVFEAVGKVGPRTFRLVEEAGEHGTGAVRLLARHGNDAPVWVVSRPRGMAIFIKYGEGAAEALVRHKAIAEPIIERFGVPAVRALTAVTPRSGRRIAILAEEGALDRIGRTPELLEVISIHGDRAVEFVWDHKATLATPAALAAWLADPLPFLDGAKELRTITAESGPGPAQEDVGLQDPPTLEAGYKNIAAATAALAAGLLLAGVVLWRRRGMAIQGSRPGQ